MNKLKKRLQELFRSNDSDLFAIGVYLADGRYILQAEKSDVMSFNLLSEDIIRHHVEASLSENSAYKAIFFDKRSNLLKYRDVDMGRSTNNENFGVFAHFLWVA